MSRMAGRPTNEGAPGAADSTGSGYRDRNSTAERALDILLMFDDDHLTVTANQVAAHLEVARSTAYRYLQSLASSGFIEEGAPSGFRLGPRILELARIARRSSGLREVARPIMLTLAQTTGETVLLTRLAGSTVLCLERSDSIQRVLRVSYEPGQSMPANAGASAHVLLAWLPEAELDSVLAGVTFERFTSETITSQAALRKRLTETRRSGYAVSRGEVDTDVLGVAAPIWDGTDRVAAAISVAAFATRVTGARVKATIAAVNEAAGQISARLRLLSG